MLNKQVSEQSIKSSRWNDSIRSSDSSKFDNYSTDMDSRNSCDLNEPSEDVRAPPSLNLFDILISPTDPIGEKSDHVEQDSLLNNNNDASHEKVWRSSQDEVFCESSQLNELPHSENDGRDTCTITGSQIPDSADILRGGMIISCDDDGGGGDSGGYDDAQVPSSQPQIDQQGDSSSIDQSADPQHICDNWKQNSDILIIYKEAVPGVRTPPQIPASNPPHTLTDKINHNTDVCKHPVNSSPNHLGRCCVSI